MSAKPIPVTFEPIFKPKPWGGRMLSDVFGKALPPDDPIGESWELVSLPGNESHVAAGPMAGRSVSDLIDQWGDDLTGGVELVDGRFPLLIKFLDARQNLSVQVHPKPADDDPAGEQPGIKHEAWYVLAAEPEAKMYIGLKPGVGPADTVRAANTPAMADLLQPRPVKPGDCFYLPSGTAHALGAGILVAEIQTPSDVTYRLYDWDRVGLDGKPRELHIEQGLANVRYDVPDDQIVQPRSHIGDVFATLTKLTACDRFTIEKLRMVAGVAREFPHSQMCIWIVLSGSGTLTTSKHTTEFKPGDVTLVPAENAGMRVEIAEECQLLEVMIPAK